MLRCRWLFPLLLIGLQAASAGAMEDGNPSPFQTLVQIWTLIGVLVLYWIGASAVVGLGLVGLSLRPATFRISATLIRNSPVRCGLLGTAGALALLLLLAVVGKVELLVALAVLGGGVLAWLALMASALVIGQRVLFGLNSGKSEVAGWNLVVGGTLLTLAIPFPVLGWLAGALALVVGLGAVLARPFAASPAEPRSDNTSGHDTQLLDAKREEA